MSISPVKRDIHEQFNVEGYGDFYPNGHPERGRIFYIIVLSVDRSTRVSNTSGTEEEKRTQKVPISTRHSFGDR